MTAKVHLIHCHGILPAGFTPPGGSLTLNLVSWWALQEATSNNRSDSVVATGNTLVEYLGGVPSSGAVAQTTGHVEANAALFNSGYLQIADNPTLVFNNSWTVAGWINLGTASGTRCLLVKSGEFRLMTLDNGGQYEAAIQSLSGGAELIYASTFGALSATTWYFVVATYDTSNWRISVNNSSFDSTAVVTPISNTGNDFAIGDVVGGGLLLGGAMEQWGFWTRVLEADEITQLYNSGNGKTYGSL